MIVLCFFLLSLTFLLSSIRHKVTLASKELEDLAVDTVKDGASFVAVDPKSNEVLGVAFNKIQVSPSSRVCHVSQQNCQN